MSTLPTITVLAATLVVACASPTPADSRRSSDMPALHPVTIDLEKHPDLQFRIDSFLVPDEVRAPFTAAMQRNIAFISTLPGYLGHVVFEKTGGPTSFNLVTIAVWESGESVARARDKVRAYYQEIGFDMRAQLAEWNVKAEIGDYVAPRALQPRR